MNPGTEQESLGITKRDRVKVKLGVKEKKRKKMKVTDGDLECLEAKKLVLFGAWCFLILGKQLKGGGEELRE